MHSCYWVCINTGVIYKISEFFLDDLVRILIQPLAYDYGLHRPIQGGHKDAPSNFFYIHAVFRENWTNNSFSHAPFELVPYPFWEILDLPLDWSTFDKQ